MKKIDKKRVFLKLSALILCLIIWYYTYAGLTEVK